MSAGTPGSTENLPTSTGLITGHAYTILSAHEVNSRGQRVKLLRLRNPWGSGEWKGQWSDGDNASWTP